MAALTATTPRQKEIKKLLGEGKNPQQIAKKLRITDNAVHQQLRRMRGNKSGGSSGSSKASGSRRKSGGSSTRRSASRSTSRSSGRQSTRTRAQAPRPATPKPPATAEELIRSEILAANEAKTEASAAIDSLRGQIEANEARIAALDSEIATKGDVLAVLTGEKVAHAKPAPPKPKRSSRSGARGASNGKAASGSGKPGDGAQASSQPPQDGGSPAAQTPAPADQAEREATADHDGTPGESGEKAPATA